MKKLGIFLLATFITWIIGFVFNYIANQFLVEDTTTLGTLIQIEIIAYGIAFLIVTFFLTEGFQNDNTWGLSIGILGCIWAWQALDMEGKNNISISGLILNIGLFIGMLLTIWKLED